MGPEGGGVAPGGWSTQKINAVQRGNNKIIKKKNVEQSTAARVEISFSFSFLFFLSCLRIWLFRSRFSVDGRGGGKCGGNDRG